MPGRESVKLTAGGLDETSYVTRLIPVTSFVMREDIFRRTSGGKTYLPKWERSRVKITKRKRSDRATDENPMGPRRLPPWCMALGRENSQTGYWSRLTSQRS